MSHFCLFVIGENPEAQVEQFLNDNIEAVQVLEEYKQSYKTDEVDAVLDPETGQYLDVWNSKFWIPVSEAEKKEFHIDDSSVTGLNLHTAKNDAGDKILIRRISDSVIVKQVLPSDQKERVTTDKVFSFEGYLRWNGFVLADSEYEYDADNSASYYLKNSKGQITTAVEFTNPKGRIDWYVVGGRYRGRLKTFEKDKVTIFYEKRYEDAIITLAKDKEVNVYDSGDTQQVTAKNLEVGQSILIGMDCCKITDVKDSARVDSCAKKDIDFDSMTEESRVLNEKLYDKVSAAIAPYKDSDYLSWEYLVSKYKNNIDTARKIYNDQPIVKAFNSCFEFVWRDKLEDFLCSKEEYLERNRGCTFYPFAIVKDGKWYEKGEMLMFGMVKDEKDDEDWKTIVEDVLFKQTGEDELITVLDCHQ